MIQQALRESQSYGEGSDAEKFDAKKEAKKEATKANAKQKYDAVSTYRRLSLIQKDIHKTQNYGLVVGEDTRSGGKDTKQRIQVGEGGGKDIRRAVACAVVICMRRKG